MSSQDRRRHGRVLGGVCAPTLLTCLVHGIRTITDLQGISTGYPREIGIQIAYRH